MEQKELERSEKSVLLDDILNSVPEETASSDVEEPNESSGDNMPDQSQDDSAESGTESDEDAGELPNADVISGESAENADEQDSEEFDGEEDEDYEEEVPKKRKKKKRGHGHIIFGLIFSVVIISVSILAAVFILKCSKEFLAIGKSDIELVVDIPMNSSTLDIAEQLYREGIISDPKLFRLFSKFKGADGTYIAGTHTLSPKMDYNTLIEELQAEAENQRETVDVIFPEGITLLEAAQRLEEKNVCSADEFIKVFNAGGFGFDFEEKVRISSLKFYKMEGYFFPDTYQF